MGCTVQFRPGRALFVCSHLSCSQLDLVDGLGESGRVRKDGAVRSRLGRQEQEQVHAQDVDGKGSRT